MNSIKRYRYLETDTIPLDDDCIDAPMDLAGIDWIDLTHEEYLRLFYDKSGTIQQAS